MSPRDADLLELITAGVARKVQEPVQVLEWGTGQSTLWLSHLLSRLGIQYVWITLEYDCEFFTNRIAPRLAERDDVITLVGEEAYQYMPYLRDPLISGMVAIVYDVGALYPWWFGYEAHRRVDLDNYVSLPSILHRRYDLIVIDGRKRRRCLLEASRILSRRGVVVLDDAWRINYSRAFEAFSWYTRIGDALWIGANEAQSILELPLPFHAFTEHLSGPRAGSCDRTFAYANSWQARSISPPDYFNRNGA
jgi:hypothetical protein